MTIKVKISGIEIEVENLDQAAGLVQRLQGQPTATHEPSNEARSSRGESPVAPANASTAEPPLVSPENKWTTFITSMNRNQRRLLRFMKSHEGATLEEVSTALAEGRNNTIAGWLTGTIRQLKKVGLRPTSVYRREQEGNGPGRIVRYHAGPMLRANEVPE